MKSSRLIATTLAVSVAAVAALLSPGAAAAAGGKTRFANFELAATPPQPVGTTCPGAGADCWNFAAEPAIRGAADGTFYASSENGLTAGTIAWKSTDGGLHYSTLPSPNGLSATQDTGFAPGGGDTDLAVAPVRNGTGFYNVYVSSLTGAEVDVSTSMDGGATWSLNATSATVPVDDREFIAADGASKVCISYRADAGTGLFINCSFDAGATFTQLASAFDADHAAFAAFSARTGNIAIDPTTHTIYFTFAAVADNDEALTCLDCGLHAVWMAVSTDGGQTFVDHPVFINPDTSVGYNHQFPNVSVDAAGNVYSVFTDDHNVYESFSTDHGTTWSAPVVVNKAPANTAIFPWSVAGAAGKLDIVYYGTSYFDGVNSPDNYPATAQWFVYFAQNLRATSGGTFTQTVASPLIHSGGVCESGVGCTGNRDLFDDFGVAANPLTGLASIIYSDDQYTNDANDPPQPGCDPADNNTIVCDHTAIATQTSGRGIS